MNRNERLAADYRGMLKIQDRPYVSWIAVKGEPPFVEEYLLTVRLKSYALGVQNDSYVVGTIPRCTVKVTLWDSYPNVAPYIRMLSIPPVFHPAWYSKGTYCPPEPWHRETPLAELVMQMLRTIRYEPEVMDFSAPANYKALDWYLKNRGSGLFPSDMTRIDENTDEQAAALEKAAGSFGEIIDSWRR